MGRRWQSCPVSHLPLDPTAPQQSLFRHISRNLTKKLIEPAPNPVCVITNRPARYRDPSTGLPFATAHAYHEIRRLIKGEYKWSRLLGAWVGTGAYAARGVPDRFLNPNAEGPVREKKNGEDDKGKETDDGNDKKGESQKEKEDGNVESEAKAGPSLDVAMGGTEVVAA